MNRYQTLAELLNKVNKTETESINTVVQYLLDTFNNDDLTDPALIDRTRATLKKKNSIDVLDDKSLSQFEDALIAIEVMRYLIRIIWIPTSYSNSAAFGMFRERYGHIIMVED